MSPIPYTTPTTITTGQFVTAALMNSHWVENIRFLANPPSCRVYHSAAQSIAHATETTAAFNSERFDTNAMHDTATNNSRITFATAGLYLVTFTGKYATAADYTATTCRIRLNGTTYIADGTSERNTTIESRIQTTTLYRFAAGDYIEVRLYQANSAAAARNLEVSGNWSPEFMAVWVGLG